VNKKVVFLNFEDYLFGFERAFSHSPIRHAQKRGFYFCGFLQGFFIPSIASYVTRALCICHCSAWIDCV